jgi:hypothetical protein
MKKQVCSMLQRGKQCTGFVGHYSPTESVFSYIDETRCYGLQLDKGYAIAAFDYSSMSSDVWEAKMYISYGARSVWPK